MEGGNCLFKMFFLFFVFVFRSVESPDRVPFFLSFFSFKIKNFVCLSRLSFCPNAQHSVSSTGGLISPFSLFFVLLLLLMIYNEIFLRPIRWIFHPEKKNKNEKSERRRRPVHFIAARNCSTIKKKEQNLLSR